MWSAPQSEVEEGSSEASLVEAPATATRPDPMAAMMQMVRRVNVGVKKKS